MYVSFSLSETVENFLEEARFKLVEDHLVKSIESVEISHSFNVPL